MRALGCLAVALLTSAGFAMPVAARSAPPTLRVAGPAGSSYWVEVSAGTQLANAGDYSTSPHSWSGLGLVRPAGSAGPAQVFVSLDLPQSVRCAGSTCPWLAPPPDLTSDGRLAPGRYPSSFSAREARRFPLRCNHFRAECGSSVVRRQRR
jgi:hypothetical protein